MAREEPGAGRRHHWARAEFPHDLIPGLAALDIMGLALDMDDRPARRRLLSGFVGMELARMDAGFASFYGVRSGLAMGSIFHCGPASSGDVGCPPCAGWRKSARSR